MTTSTSVGIPDTSRKQTVIAGLAIVAIALHLLLRFLARCHPAVDFVRLSDVSRLAKETAMTRKEIDILVEAARKSCAVVEKASHVLWTHADLLEARMCGCYQDAGELLPPDGHMDVNSPYPGCVQMAGQTDGANAYRAVGQTQHFVIFANPSTVE